jgi:hypothetical protein
VQQHQAHALRECVRQREHPADVRRVRERCR